MRIDPNHDSKCHNAKLEMIMKNTNSKFEADILRQKAEEFLKKKPVRPDLPTSAPDTLHLFHELEVYQLELEMQNNDLRHAWAVAEVAVDKYTELYDFSPSGYFTLSKTGKIIELNASGSQMLGKEIARLSNSQFGFFVSEEDKPNFNLFLEKVFISSEKESCQVAMSTNDNLPLLVQLTGIATKNGEQCFITMVDITESKQAEESLLLMQMKRASELITANKELAFQNEEKAKRAAELLIANEELTFQNEEKAKRAAELIIANKELAFQAELIIANKELQKLNIEKDKFFSIIAHDLRSPFTVFLGFTRMMVEDLPSMTLDEIQQIALTMQNSATNLFLLLENLLEWSCMKRGITTFNPASFALMPVVTNSMVFSQESANNKDIELRFNIPGDLVVYADEIMLSGIIRNLSTNAIKFTPKGGKVTFTAKLVPDNSIEISIQDTGIGMNNEMVENLFHLDINTSRKGTEGEPSTGLGLIICSEYIEKHGGRLWVESKVDNGTTFYFTLPGEVTV